MNVLLQSRFVVGIRFINKKMRKRKGIGNRFTEKWVIKIVKRFREKFLICFQINFFAFPRTWLLSYMFSEEGHVFSFLNKSFSMQIKNFSWGLSSDKREFSSEKVIFLPTYRYCLHYKRHFKRHIHNFWVAQWRCLIDLSTVWKTGCGSEISYSKKPCPNRLLRESNNSDTVLMQES